ncbi:D-alanyl-D-alanine carboxypeptidase [Chryseobacterium defluvii]|uniref:D-alanyl-D-alanine carboxypeptidase n=1 Tax=Chryseobacterium defluvii TaxID=160396 RepID=A0A840KA22_9FLAO|nr:serine hydrolase domain-containing protein [Chryseobacterium defluvii]MBB4806066.1 D-alanyl-D-alanine carboxypeptidase [Chryseobacterium defluvii]
MIKKICFLVALNVSSLVFSQNNIREKLGSYLDSLFVHHKVMGSFAFAEKDQPAFLKVTGFADAAKQQKANMNTQYRIGSISKTFTAVLVMKAVEDKKLSTDTKLSEFYPGIENAKKITIEHLLQHRSGIHSLTDEGEFWNYYTQPQSEAQLVSIIQKYKSDFLPGIKHEYSNSNYILLGLILEKVYKKEYAQLVQDKIARSLKLTLTKVGGKINTSENQALSYQYMNGNYQPLPETDMSIPIGAGNIISTPTELLKFITGLENGKLITKTSLKQMKIFVDDYGYGLVKVPFEKYSGFGHTGGIDGFSSVLYYFPELKTAVSFVTNQSDYKSENIFSRMMEAALGRDFKMPDFKGIVLSEDELKEFAGTYSTAGMPVKFNIFIKDKTLMAQATGQSAFPLEATSKTSFKFDGAGITVDFNLGEKQFVITQNSHATTFKKE